MLSNGRLLLAALLTLVLWFTFVRPALSPWWPVAAAGAFAALAIVHARVLERIERARGAERVYLRGLERLDGRWAGIGRDGGHFIADHPYARDLDLFGRASLFELLNTARTEIGEATLADWLRAGAAPEEVVARQAAVDELRSNLDLREELAVLAAESDVSRTGALAQWAVAPATRFPAPLQIGLGACTVITVALFARMALSSIGSVVSTAINAS